MPRRVSSAYVSLRALAPVLREQRTTPFLRTPGVPSLVPRPLQILRLFAPFGIREKHNVQINLQTLG